MTKRYDNESISSLKGADRVRLRPGVIFGSDDLDGCKHSFFEILSNSIDEAREGHGNLITVTVYKDKSIRIEDFGRGIPLDYNDKEKRWNWELVYCELYAGGKYNNNSGSHYEFSLGLNGLGACATQYASRYFDVEVFRDGYKYELHFERGENIGGLKKTPVRTRRTGTVQHWLPDDEVFTSVDIPKEYFADILKKQAIVNPGVTFKLVYEADGSEEGFTYPEGILGYVKEINADKGISEPILIEGEGTGRDRKDKPDYKVVASIAFCFNNTVNHLAYYHNSSYLEHGGAPDRAVRIALVAEFDRALKEHNKYKANESKITFSDIEDSLILVISSFSTVTSYANQTKKAINNRFIQQFLTDFIRREIEVWMIENQPEALRVMEQILVNKRSRERAESQRLNIRKKLMGSIDMMNRVKNFVDCRSKNPSERELYIVEGNSALGSVKMARDAEFQGVIPLRGKILNCMKADYSQIFKNDIIMDLIKILGCGVEIKSKHNKQIANFDLDQLRWNKIVICTDADVDGFQIRTLILAMIYRLIPTLINEGKVFIAESPLFEITHVYKGIEKTHFAYSDAEKNAIVKELTDGRIHIQRSKGLGENEPEMMWLTTMNPETRRLIEIVPESPEVMQEMFDVLLGDDLDGRKQYIADFGSDYMEMLDVV